VDGTIPRVQTPRVLGPRFRSGHRPRRFAYLVGPFGEGTRRVRDGGTSLPYGSHHLADAGYTVIYCDPLASVPVRRAHLGRPIRAAHRLIGKPLLYPVLEPLRILRADLFVCFLEDNLDALWLLVRLRRLLTRRSGHRSVLVVCWLAEDARRLPARHRRRWRRRLTSFDRVVVFSANQVAILQTELRLPAGLVEAVPFGVTVAAADDSGPSTPSAPSGPAGPVVAAGVDQGRDYPTFVEALGNLPTPVTIVTNTEQARALHTRGRVSVIGPLPRQAYLATLREAEIMVLPTHELAYPTGQTVLLESLALGKPCVVTRSAALDDYVSDGVDVLLVPAGDAAALREAVEQLQSDAELRHRLAVAARRTGLRFSESRMWTAIVAASQR
jgi:glycosyltransferase involved in cell wall biosynthesis